MSDSYPSLGFDPAPGNTGNVDSLAARTKKAANALDNAQNSIKRLTGNVSWAGDAASAFSKKVGELPRYLKDSQEAMSTASSELTKWRGALSDYQSTARTYEVQAKRAKGQVTTAEKSRDAATNRYNQAASDPAYRLSGQYFTGPALQDAQNKIDAANTRLQQADDDLSAASARLEQAERELEEIIKNAERLLEEHQAQARGVADRLRKANDSAPDPGFWERLGDQFQKLGHAIQEWCARNKDLLKSIGDWLGNISAVLGILSLLTLWCPPLSGALALAGAALSAGALLAHGAAKLGGADVSMLDLAGDALGVIPGVGFAKTAVTGTVKVAVGTVDTAAGAVSRVDDVQKVMRLNRLVGEGVADGSNFAREAGRLRSAAEGRIFEATGAGNKLRLAWENSVATNLGSQMAEKGLSATINRIPGLRDMDSLRSAIRVDDSLDPLSWWSKGPLLATQIPGAATGIYDSITGD
ncbi:putative T7SS-secreted protein [Streptomyces sp. SCSIO 30461]|uniref:putative T7SS-secreted protein n=1 Tax=Streptomyces sp. SCSIO 30461 TaxID=3118085 RepID=UPI0030CC1893